MCASLKKSTAYRPTPRQFGADRLSLRLSLAENDDIAFSDDFPVSDDTRVLDDITPSNGESWSILKKAFFFGVIMAAVVLYVRSSKRGQGWEDVRHEKSLA